MKRPTSSLLFAPSGPSPRRRRAIPASPSQGASPPARAGRRAGRSARGRPRLVGDARAGDRRAREPGRPCGCGWGRGPADPGRGSRDARRPRSGSRACRSGGPGRRRDRPDPPPPVRSRMARSRRHRTASGRVRRPHTPPRTPEFDYRPPARSPLGSGDAEGRIDRLPTGARASDCQQNR
jgi:hypothetical protein